MNSALSWNVIQRSMVIHYRRFGTVYLSNLHGSTIQISESQKILRFLTHEEGTRSLPRNVGKDLTVILCAISHKSADFRYNTDHVI